MMKLDLTGLCCSVPQMLVYSKIKKMRKGDTLEIIVEKGSSQELDVIRVLEFFKCNTNKIEMGDKCVYFVQK